MSSQALEAQPDDRWNIRALGYLLAQTGRERKVLHELTSQRDTGKPVGYSVARKKQL